MQQYGEFSMWRIVYDGTAILLYRPRVITLSGKHKTMVPISAVREGDRNDSYTTGYITLRRESMLLLLAIAGTIARQHTR